MAQLAAIQQTRRWQNRAEDLEELLHRARQRLARAEQRYDTYANVLGAYGGHTLEALRAEAIEATTDLEILQTRLAEAKRKAKQGT